MYQLLLAPASAHVLTPSSAPHCTANHYHAQTPSPACQSQAPSPTDHMQRHHYRASKPRQQRRSSRQQTSSRVSPPAQPASASSRTRARTAPWRPSRRSSARRRPCGSCTQTSHRTPCGRAASTARACTPCQGRRRRRANTNTNTCDTGQTQQAASARWVHLTNHARDVTWRTCSKHRRQCGHRVARSTRTRNAHCQQWLLPFIHLCKTCRLVLRRHRSSRSRRRRRRRRSGDCRRRSSRQWTRHHRLARKKKDSKKAPSCPRPRKRSPRILMLVRRCL